MYDAIGLSGAFSFVHHHCVVSSLISFELSGSGLKRVDFPEQFCETRRNSSK